MYHASQKPLRTGIAALALCFVLLLPETAGAVRIKDIASFGGVRDNQLVGYGLVVGLGGTGDRRDSPFTVDSMVNMLENMGVSVDRSRIRPRNTAAVMITARMPVSARPGSRLDVTVSSLGDATSLQGGVLLMSPLKGVDGNIYGLAQGPLVLGGFAAGGEAATMQRNVVTVGAIPGGMTVERGVPFAFNNMPTLTLHMRTADFSTTQSVVESLNAAMGGNYARAEDISSIVLTVPREFQGNLVPLMASIENIEIMPDAPARVVVDEKTGTVVLGRNVRISRVAVAHGNISVMVQEFEDVSQPTPFTQGQTVVSPVTGLTVREDNRRLMLMEGATLQELVDGLNAVGATPRDLISILRTMKAAGALHAEIEVI
jgi:flagellar P-ring protein precursor FlgI